MMAPPGCVQQPLRGEALEVETIHDKATNERNSESNLDP